MKQQVFNGYGKKKSSIANCKLFLLQLNSSLISKVRINNVEIQTYFKNDSFLLFRFNSFFSIIQFDRKLYILSFKVSGGGKVSQLDALLYSFVDALYKLNINFKEVVKKTKYYVIDNRQREREKPGLKGPRRGRQFSKR